MASESDFQNVVRWAVERQGYWTRHIPRNQRIGPQKGAPDLLCFHPWEGVNCQIEVKIQRPQSPSWSMEELDVDQRKYLDNIICAGGDAYIAFGVIRFLGTSKSRSKIVDGYIIPWMFWKRLEEYYQSMFGQISIPYDWDMFERKPAYWGTFADLKSLLEESHECPIVETKITKDEYPALPERCKIRLSSRDIPPYYVRRKESEENGVEVPMENRYSVITGSA